MYLHANAKLGLAGRFALVRALNGLEGAPPGWDLATAATRKAAG